MKKHGQMSETTAVMTLLTLSGGLQDAYSYFVRGKVFANAQTGNIVLLGGHFFEGEWEQVPKYLFPLCFFAVGILITEQIRGHLQKMQRLHWRQLVVALEILMLLIVSLLPVSEVMDPLANALTSCACAMQVQAFRKVNGCGYASTMCIGNMRSGMEAFSAYLRLRERKLLTKALQYFQVIFIFFLGAGIGKRLTELWGQRCILVSCILLLIGFCIMFIQEEHEEAAAV